MKWIKYSEKPPPDGSTILAFCKCKEYHIIKSFSKDFNDRRDKRFPAWAVEYYVIITNPIIKVNQTHIQLPKPDKDGQYSLF